MCAACVLCASSVCSVKSGGSTTRSRKERDREKEKKKDRKMQLRRRSTVKGQAVDVDEQEEADAATLDAAGKAALAMSSHDLRIKVPPYLAPI